MAIKYMMKNPILMVGILFMAIFLLSLKNKGFFSDRNDKLKATSCSAALIMLNKRIPQTWHTKCTDNNLVVIIDTNHLASKQPNLKRLRPIFYRELANNLIFISKNSANDSLERVFMVSMKMFSDKLTLNAVTEGRYLARLGSLKSPKFIAEHLRSTVQTQEVVKK